MSARHRTREGAGRRRLLTRAAWATVPAVLAVLAIVDPGAPVSQVDLHDGAVWVTNESALSLGRYNPVVEELNAGLVSPAAPFDVAQGGADVLLVARGTLAVVDPAMVALAAQTTLPVGADVATAGGTVAVTGPEGQLWVRTTGDVGTLRAPADTPDLDLAGGAAVVADDGTALAVTGTGALHRLTPTPAGPAKAREAGSLDLPGPVDALTAVGDEPVVLSGRTVVTRHAVVDLPVQGALVLQQPGPAADVVLVAASGALLEVPLRGGDVRELPGGRGTPAAPVRVAGCAHAAWSAPGDNYLRVCGGRADAPLTLHEVASSDRLVFRVNRDAVVLNDVANGRLWLPTADAEVRVPNWTDVEEEETEDTQDQDSATVTTEALQAECATDAAPPSAADDEYGVRPGRTVILPVVANDAASACGVLAISSHDDVDPRFGTLTPVHGGRALQLDVRPDADGSATFVYSVDDGRGTAAPSTATVRVDVHGPGENGAPEQLRVGALVVEQGGTGTYDALADFRDPDGDPLVLLSAIGTGGSARARGDGRLQFQADTSSLGRQTVRLQVSDGTATVEGTVFVDIRPAGSLPPVLEPQHVVTTVDAPVTVDALAAVRSHGREPVRLAAVDEVPGLTFAPDLEAGTFTVTARTAGTFYVPYTVAAPPQQASGLVRLDVLADPEDSGPPVAVLDLALLPAGGDVTIDPLANDTDPAGAVLVVQEVTVAEGSPLRVAVIEHGLVQVSATRTLEAPETFTYTVSNGLETAVGQVVVQPVPPTVGQQPPVVPDATATVRTGGVVTIPVLEDAFDPEGDALTLERDLVEPPEAGLMFVSGDVLRYQAPGTPMQVRATFEVSDAAGNRSAATVTITVHASDAESKSPPRPRDLTARAYAGEEVVIDVPLVGIDDDGDGVTLLGVDRPPTRGVVRRVGSDSLVYEALAGEQGTDEFTYAVEDWAGRRAVATVRVGIAPRPTGAVPVVLRDDAVTVRPGRTVEVRVLANDESGGGGELTLDEALVVQPEGASARVEGRRVVVDAPEVPGVLQILYTARNERGGQDTAVLTVTVDPEAPIQPPRARDIVVPAVDTINKTQVAVDVMQTAQNPSGSLADLVVEVPESAGATAVAPGDGTVVVTLAPEPQTLPYRLVNTHPDAEGIFSYAFITVPALGDFPPTRRPGTEDLTVIAGEPLVLELDELVRVAPGRSPRIGDRERVFATRADGSPLVVDADTIRYVPRSDYSGPAAVTAYVTDGPPTDPTVHDATITFEITVLAREENPPLFTPSVLEVPQGESVRVDLAAFTSAPARASDDASARYTYRLGTAPTGFDVSLTGSQLAVRALPTTTRGTVAAVPVLIGYGGDEPLAVQVDARVVASRQPLARVRDFHVPDGVEGGQSVVNVLDGAFNPFAPTPLQVVAAVVETPGAGDARVSGGSVVVSPARGFLGPMVVRYTVKDALADLDRMVEGRITVVVRGKPAAPTAPRVVEARDRAVALAWDAPANNGEPIDSYRVTAVGTGITQTCPATACTITGLTNDVRYTFTVAAHNAVGWSEPSPPSGEARPDTQPLAPGAPSLSRGDGVLDVRWAPPENPGSPIVEYQLEITPATPAGVTSVTTTATSVRLGGLANGTDYSVRVRARNSAPQPGAWSPAATGRPARVPDAPGVAATRAAEGTSITVSWSAPGSDGGERVEAYDVHVDGTVVATVGPEQRQWVFDVEQGRRYTVGVRARNAVGASEWGTAVGQIYGRPGAVTGLTALDVTGAATAWGEGQVTATWAAPARAGGQGLAVVGYDVALVDAAGVRVRSARVTDTAWSPQHLRGGTYTLTVAAVNSEGLVGPEATTTVTTVTVPARPAEPTWAADETGVVTLTWRAPSDGGSPVTGFRVRDVDTDTEHAVPATSTTLQLPGTYAPGATITVTLRALNVDGSGEAVTSTFTVPGGEPLAGARIAARRMTP